MRISWFSCRFALPAAATALASFMLGCAATPTLPVRRADPPPPAVAEGVAWADDVFAGAGGLELYARSFRPKEGEPRGVVIFQNGLKDHGDHYAKVAQELVHHGYAAYAFDMRGHGRSAGPRVGVGRFDDYLDDLELYVARVRAREPGKPIFVFGHSLGGAIVTLYGIERRPDVAGLVLSGPGVAIDAPPLQIAVVRLVDGLAPDAPLLDPHHADFSRDPAVVADMDRDPLIFQPPGPVHTAAETLAAAHRIWEHPEALTAPLLVLHGTDDKLTAPSGSRELVRLAGSKDKTLRLYPGYYHDLVHEPGHERVTGDLVAWLDAHNGGAGPAPASDAPPGADADTLPLKGDHGASSTSLELDARGEHAFAAGGVPFAATGGLRLRQGFGRVGWLGGVDARAGSEAGLRWEADAHPLGLGVRLGQGQLGVTGGIGARGVDGTTTVHVPSELALELALGPLRTLARGGLGWRLNHGGPGKDVLGIADEASALLGVRLGRDLRYWADVSAGQGPFLALTFARRDGGELWGVALGIDLWGANGIDRYR
jgi:acylglycerol lipase